MHGRRDRPPPGIRNRLRRLPGALCGAGSSHPRVQRGLRPAHVVSLHDLRSRRARYRDAHTHVRPWPNPVGWRDDAGRRGHQRQEPDRRRRRARRARPGHREHRRAGRRTVALEGTSTYTKPSGSNQRRRSWETEAFKRTVSDDPMEVPVGTAGGNPPCRSAARRPAPPASPRPAPSWWPASACPAAPWSAPSPTRPAFPTASSSPSTTGRTRPISSPPTRFTGQRPYVSSDYLFDLLRPSGGMPGAPTGNSVGAGGTLAGSRLGSWDALIPPGAKFLTPSGQPKRLGDGYEQKAVSDQILPPPASASWRSTATTTRSTRPCSRPAPSSRRTTASSSASR